MNLLEALANWATGFVTAAVVAALSFGAPGAPAVNPEVVNEGGILAWAQDVDEATIQQVGEATEEDAEALDAGSVSAEESAPSTREVAVSQTGDDVELLDRGTPPQETATTTAVETTAVDTAAPLTVVESTSPAPAGDVVVTASAVDSGPHLPEGFGEGQVMVSTASGDFPPGLDECHVGAVTGRAYVGIDCDDEGSSFVGHAPTFEDFPFVTDEDFPFDNDDPIVADENFPFGDESTSTIELNSDPDVGTNVLVAAGGRREGPLVSLPEGSEGAVIERAQRVGGEVSDERSTRKSKRERSTSISVDASSGNSNGNGNSSSTDRVQSASQNTSENKRTTNASSKENKNGKANHNQKQKAKKGKNKKANKDSKSDDKGKKAKKNKKQNRNKDR